MAVSKKPQKTRFQYIDLFAGCGGLALGLHNAGWRGIFAVEKDKFAFTTLNHNLIKTHRHYKWPDWLPTHNHEIDFVLENHVPNLRELQGRIDLVAGGPPCQGFSMDGRRSATDKRNKLVHSYVEFI